MKPDCWYDVDIKYVEMTKIITQRMNPMGSPTIYRDVVFKNNPMGGVTSWDYLDIKYHQLVTNVG